MIYLLFWSFNDKLCNVSCAVTVIYTWSFCMNKHNPHKIGFRYISQNLWYKRFATLHLASMGWAKATARRDEIHLNFGIWCVSYYRSEDSLNQVIVKHLGLLSFIIYFATFLNSVSIDLVCQFYYLSTARSIRNCTQSTPFQYHMPVVIWQLR